MQASRKALDLALKHNSNLHILHLSTVEELSMLGAAHEKNPNISGEICVNYLFFDDSAYDRFGPLIKCNPSIKANADMLALRAALNDGTVRCIGTDHDPRGILSRAGHVESCPNQRGPSRKAKYFRKTDSGPVP